MPSSRWIGSPVLGSLPHKTVPSDRNCLGLAETSPVLSQAAIRSSMGIDAKRVELASWGTLEGKAGLLSAVLGGEIGYSAPCAKTAHRRAEMARITVTTARISKNLAYRYFRGGERFSARAVSHVPLLTLVLRRWGTGAGRSSRR